LDNLQQIYQGDYMKKISFKLIFEAIAIVAGLVVLPSSQANAASGCVVYTYR